MNEPKVANKFRGNISNAVVVSGIFIGFLLILYLIAPGFVIGFLFHMGVSRDAIKSGVGTYMPLQVYVAERVEFVGDFYEWQIELMGIE